MPTCHGAGHPTGPTRTLNPLGAGESHWLRLSPLPGYFTILQHGYFAQIAHVGAPRRCVPFRGEYAAVAQLIDGEAYPPEAREEVYKCQALQALFSGFNSKSTRSKAQVAPAEMPPAEKLCVLRQRALRRMHLANCIPSPAADVPLSHRCMAMDVSRMQSIVFAAWRCHNDPKDRFKRTVGGPPCSRSSSYICWGYRALPSHLRPNSPFFSIFAPLGDCPQTVGCCCELTRRLRGLGVVPSVGVDFDTCRWGGACHREE